MNAISDNQIQNISTLFGGYEHARGSYVVKGTNERGKTEGKALTHKGAASDADWRAHLAGTGPGLGVIPLLADDTVVWGCIDIGVYSSASLLTEIEAKCKRFDLPLVLCRTKSGGVHAFLFLAERIPARIVVPKLESMAAVLGYGGCEIFPKQTSRYDENDKGNWLNMPYFYAERTNRYGVKDGEPLELDEFLAFAQRRRVTLAQLDDLCVQPANDEGGLFEDGPPCLQHLAANGGFPDGTRNEGMFNVAVYLKKRGVDNLDSLLNEYNMKMAEPPLTPDDVSAIAKSVGKKDYEYKCRKAPISSHCNRSICVTRACGVDDNVPRLSLTKVAGEPVLWLIEIGGKRIRLDTNELTTQKKFQEKIAAAVGIYPRTLRQSDWEQKLNDWLQTASTIEVDEDDTDTGVFKAHFRSFIAGKAKCREKADLFVSSSPYVDENGDVWFKLDALETFLFRQGYSVKRSHLVDMLKEVVKAYSSKQDIKVQDGWRQKRVWIVPHDAAISVEAFGELIAQPAASTVGEPVPF